MGEGGPRCNSWSRLISYIRNDRLEEVFNIVKLLTTGAMTHARVHSKGHLLAS
jgi:hypothetical protein